MTSILNREADQTEVAESLTELLRRRGELLPAAVVPYVLSELTSIDRRIAAARTGSLAYDLAA
jgi:hypothetical protein